MTSLWRRRAIYRLPGSPSQTCHAKPKLKSTGAGRYQLLSVGVMPTARSIRKTSPKVRTLWHCSRLRSVALTYDWSVDIRQAIDRCSNIWASLPLNRSVRYCRTAWLQNSAAGGTYQRLMYEQSHRDYLRPGYLHHRLPVMQLLIITVITPLPTKPSATKCQRTEAGERGNYWHADASAWCCCARCKIHEGELADAKAENDALRDDVAVGRRRSYRASVSRVKQLPASGVDTQPPPDQKTPLNGIISPQERGWSLCKNNWKEPSVY